MPLEDKDLNREFSYASRAAKGDIAAGDVSDEELMHRAARWLEDLAGRQKPLATRKRRPQNCCIQMDAPRDSGITNRTE
jgi:hypothetical protein